MNMLHISWITGLTVDLKKVDHTECQKVNESYDFYNHNCSECIKSAYYRVIEGLREFVKDPKHFYDNRENRNPDGFNLTDICSYDDPCASVSFEAWECVSEAITYGTKEQYQNIDYYICELDTGEELTKDQISYLANMLESIEKDLDKAISDGLAELQTEDEELSEDCSEE